MLEKLGAYLRILGLDAHVSRLHGKDLVQQAVADRRVLLSRSRRLCERAPLGGHVFFVEDTDPVLQLQAVVRAFAIDPYERLFTRCIRCNVELVELGEHGEWTKRVPPQVLERYARFWSCPACSTIFWRGTHVANTCAKLGLTPHRDGE